MKEVTFNNRVPTYPGRVTLTPVSGQANTYDMVRADEPIVEGTPLDRATFDSIIQSRLTGRFYVPNVAYSLGESLIGLTASPLPTSGWVYDTNDNNIATNGSYKATVSSNYSSSYRVAGAFNSDGWRNANEYNPWIQIENPQAIKVNTVSCAIVIGNADAFEKLVFQGSNDGTTWRSLGSISSIDTDSAVRYNLATPGDYKYFRLYFTFTDSTIVTVRNLRYSNYDIRNYTNAFTVIDGVPALFTVGQRMMIQTPTDLSTFAVSSNALNGVTVNTILQPNKRYELRYTGTQFVAKEV